MKSTKISLIGAGGHCLVVVDALQLAYPERKFEIRDDNIDLIRKNRFGDSIQHPAIVPTLTIVHLCVGNNMTRANLYQSLKAHCPELFTIIHPKSTISHSAILGQGNFIAAQSVIGPFATVGQGCIINHTTIIDHECTIGNWCHVAPHATLGGNVTVEDYSFIGANATILPGLTIGRGAIIGAGAVVTKDVRAGQTVIGVPARSR